MKKINKPKIKSLVLFLFIIIFITESFGQNSMFSGNAIFQFSDSTISVSTGKVERKWSWTGSGFVTSSYKNLISGKEWVGKNDKHTNQSVERIKKRKRHKTGTLKLLQPNICCLYYSVANDGQLVAYRKNGEIVLSPDNFVKTMAEKKEV